MSEEITPEITPTTFPKRGNNPLFEGMPDYLKDPKNFRKIEKAILDAGATRHSHAEIVDWAGCKECQQKQWDRKEMMIKLGFTSGKQYMDWKKVHTKIKERYPLVDWNA